MLRLSCVVVARQLEAFHDGELAVEEQIAIENHVSVCSACAYSVRHLRVIGEALRAAAGADAAAPAETEGMRAEVVSRHKAEQAEALETRVSEMFEDMHLVWGGPGRHAGNCHVDRPGVGPRVLRVVAAD